MEAAGLFETTRRHTPEDRNLNIHRRENLKLKI
jgi:hypothetical protein